MLDKPLWNRAKDRLEILKNLEDWYYVQYDLVLEFWEDYVLNP